MTLLRGRRVLLGVSGGIAAYKAPQLVRDLRAAGAEVRVVLTRGAAEFVSPMALQVVSGNRVGTELFELSFEHEIGHIELARWADVVLIAPATANCVARLANGMADDLLTTVVLATRAPVVVAPAMNTQMLGHAATQENLARLGAREGVCVVPSDAGELACGEVGAGRLPDGPVLIAELERALAPRLLAGRRVTITAGPTREHFDPVRFISNPSSGRMGYALAQAARACGADVTLVSGPVAIAPPWGVRVARVETAAEMRDAVAEHRADILIMAAAVADYTPAERLDQKKKKSDGDWVPRLVRTVDILAEVSAGAARPTLVIGFAAETEHIEENALRKLFGKRLDGIVANSVAGTEGAFGNGTNRVTMMAPSHPKVVAGPAPKEEVAYAIIDWIGTLWAAVSGRTE
jgi:phosphopantothenoylcysteine decarboxylase/phosphopantothenate--cysteine ligase